MKRSGREVCWVLCVRVLCKGGYALGKNGVCLIDIKSIMKESK